MWKPPADQVETIADTGWRPPTDAVDSETEQTAIEPPQPDSASNLWGSSPELRTALQSDHPIWNSLQVPSQMAERGLAPVTHGNLQIEPTGNVPWDVIKNIPSVAAETLAEAAPGFVSRASLLTGAISGALPYAGKALAPVAKWGAGVAEDWSVIKPGTLEAAANDASLIFAKGPKSASPLYEEAKTGGQMATQLRGIPTKEKLIDVSAKLADEGILPAENALEARKVVGAELRKKASKYTADYLHGLYDKFNTIAKSAEGIAEGDVAYQRGLQAQSMRKLFPSNVSGRASPMKVGEAGWLGHAFGWPGKVLAVGTSPIVQGTVATLGGVLGRVASNPVAAITARQALITQFVDHRTHQDQ